MFGGELGVAIATNYLRPQSVALYVQENYRSLLVKLRLKPDPQGSITLVQQFGTANSKSPTAKTFADPPLIYAELMMTGNDRLSKTDNLLLESIIP